MLVISAGSVPAGINGLASGFSLFIIASSQQRWATALARWWAAVLGGWQSGARCLQQVYLAVGLVQRLRRRPAGCHWLAALHGTHGSRASLLLASCLAEEKSSDEKSAGLLDESRSFIFVFICRYSCTMILVQQYSSTSIADPHKRPS